MSKQDKALKRERRKADRERRRLRFLKPQAATCPLRGEAMSRGLKPAAAALAAAAAIAGGTQAYASPVRFDNPAGTGHFDWADPVLGYKLDLTLPVGDQPPASLGATVVRQAVAPAVQLVGGPDLQVGPAFPDSYWVVGVNASDLIPTPGTSWRPASSGAAYVAPYFGYPSLLTPGEQTYLGARFDLGGGFQYAWIGVNVGSDYTLDAFAWGYETEPGVSIPAGAPEPGTLALLAFGAVAALRKRRTA